MGKGKKKTGRIEKKKVLKEVVNVPQTNEAVEEENEAFNFGGLPPRDLKKNLGCG